jgi:hypothetical protein
MMSVILESQLEVDCVSSLGETMLKVKPGDKWKVTFRLSSWASLLTDDGQACSAII